MEGARLAHGTLPQMLPFYKTDANAGKEQIVSLLNYKYKIQNFEDTTWPTNLFAASRTRPLQRWRKARRRKWPSAEGWRIQRSGRARSFRSSSTKPTGSSRAENSEKGQGPRLGNLVACVIKLPQELCGWVCNVVGLTSWSISYLGLERAEARASRPELSPTK